MIDEFFRHLWIVLFPPLAHGSVINPLYILAILVVFIFGIPIAKIVFSILKVWISIIESTLRGFSGISIPPSYSCRLSPKPQYKPKSHSPYSIIGNTSTSVSGVSTWNNAITKPDTDPISASINSIGEFVKIMYHGTKTLEAATEILKHNLWKINSCAVQGINFGNINTAGCYGKYIVQVEIRCLPNEVSDDRENTEAKIIRCHDWGEYFQYFVPFRPTADGVRVRPSIVKPLKILMKGDD